MRTLLNRTLLSVLFAVSAATAAGAQTPTPEGTVITNTATASYTDANGNTYANVTANVAVTVGFTAGVDAQAPASQSPVAGSSGNTVNVTIVNTGNGTDQFSLAVAPPANVTVTGFVFGGTPYATAAALNTALAAANVAAGGNVVVQVVYSVGAGASGTGNLVSTATSVRTNTVNDAATTALTFTSAPIVQVATAPATSQRLPSANAGQTYTQTYSVSNTGSAAGDFNITVSTNANITGAVLSTASIAGLAPGASQNVTVTYNVLSSAALGASGTIQVTATNTANAAITSNATHTVTVIRPLLAMTKAVFRANGTTPIGGADRVTPGEIITYRITVQNSGTADASTISVSDALPAGVTFQAGSLTQDPTGGWTLNQAAGTVTGTLPTVAVGVSRFFSFRVTVQ